MITGKDITKKLAIEYYFEEKVNILFSNIKRDSFRYLDEIYISIADRISRIRDIGKVKYPMIKESSIFDSKVFDDFAYSFNELSEVNYTMIPESYTHLQEIADIMYENDQKINESLNNCENIFKTIETELKHKLATKSIKDEEVIYDTLGYSSFLENGDLTLYSEAKTLILPVVSSINIPYNITLSCNKKKGSRKIPDFRSNTWDSIDNGYFYSRMFADNPRFEIDQDGSISNIFDNSIETSLNIEYNSTSYNDDMEISYNLEFDKTRIDYIKIIFDSLGSESVVTLNKVYPKLTSLNIGNTGSSNESIIDRVIDNRININGDISGEYEDRIKYASSDIFPGIGYIINNNDLTSVNLKYLIDIPQEIYYPEKVLYNSDKTPIYRFNYYETLVLNGYKVPADRISKDTYNVDSFHEEETSPLLSNPYTYYTQSEYNTFKLIINNSIYSADDKVKLYRYSLGIKEMQLYRNTYTPAGTAISSNLIKDGKKVGSVELYVNEIIKPDTNIRYYISIDSNIWYPLCPASRTEISQIPRRITFKGFDSDNTDLVVYEDANMLYLKIEMEGTENITPILNAYAVKVKYI